MSKAFDKNVTKSKFVNQQVSFSRLVQVLMSKFTLALMILVLSLFLFFLQNYENNVHISHSQRT